jgi:hypothetical protein
MSVITARLKELQTHPRFLLALPAATLAVTLAACGGSPGSPSPKPTGAAHSQPAATHAAPAQPPAQTANPIPQGNGGDHDADNNGGPSDGDGNI